MVSSNAGDPPLILEPDSPPRNAVVRIGSVRPPPVRALPGTTSACTTGGCLGAQQRRVLPSGRSLGVLTPWSGEDRESTATSPRFGNTVGCERRPSKQSVGWIGRWTGLGRGKGTLGLEPDRRCGLRRGLVAGAVHRGLSVVYPTWVSCTIMVPGERHPSCAHGVGLGRLVGWDRRASSVFLMG